MVDESAPTRNQQATTATNRQSADQKATAADRSPADKARSRGGPAVLALLTVVGAAAAVVSGGLTWWRQTHADALAGAVVTTATGSQSDALLIPVALVALAGFGAALAVTGVLRRVVGVALLLGGGFTAALAIAGAANPPARLLSSLSRPADSSQAPGLQPIPVVLGVLGALLIAVVGTLTAAGFGARRTLGSRYDAPTSRRAGTAPSAESRHDAPTNRRARAVPPADSHYDGPTRSRARTTSPAGSRHDAPISRRAETASPPADNPGARADIDADASALWWKALDAGRDPTQQ